MTVTRPDAPPGKAEVVRFAIGFLSLVAGGFWLVMALTVPYPRDIFVGAAVAAGGGVLLAWKRLRPPVRPAIAVAALGGVAGTAAGLAVRRVDMGGMFGWSEHRGWPFAWLGRAGLADSIEEARRQATTGGWGVDWFRMCLDAVVWSYTSLVLVVVLCLVLRVAVRRRTAA